MGFKQYLTENVQSSAKTREILQFIKNLPNKSVYNYLSFYGIMKNDVEMLGFCKFSVGVFWLYYLSYIINQKRIYIMFSEDGSIVHSSGEGKISGGPAGIEIEYVPITISHFGTYNVIYLNPKYYRDWFKKLKYTDPNEHYRPEDEIEQQEYAD